MTVSDPCKSGFRHNRCQLPDCGCRCHKALPYTSTRTRGPAHRPDFTLEWEEPPGVKRTTVPIEQRALPFIEQLREHPKRWARIAVYHSKTGAGNAGGKLRKAYKDCEFTTRLLEDDMTAVYGRCVIERGDEEQ